MSDYVLVLITCGSEDEARLIARALVYNSLAAGVQRMPIESVYRWEGEVVEDKEWLLIAKTRTERFADLRAIVEGLHSYEVPPIVQVEISDANQPYLAWIDGVVTPGSD